MQLTTAQRTLKHTSWDSVDQNAHTPPLPTRTLDKSKRVGRVGEKLFFQLAYAHPNISKKAYLKFEHSLKYFRDISHTRNIYKVAIQSELTQLF